MPPPSITACPSGRASVRTGAGRTGASAVPTTIGRIFGSFVEKSAHRGGNEMSQTPIVKAVLDWLASRPLVSGYNDGDVAFAIEYLGAKPAQILA